MVENILEIEPMKVHNSMGETLTIGEGETVRCRIRLIRKSDGKLVEIDILDTY